MENGRGNNNKDDKKKEEKSKKVSLVNGKCVQPEVTKNDPKYLTRPIVDPECELDPRRPVERFDEATRKRAYLSDVLKQELERLNREAKEEEERRRLAEETGSEEAEEATQADEEISSSSSKTFSQLNFLKSHQEYQVAGRNPLRIKHDDFKSAMNGLTNMHLAHEICVNHDFKLERYKLPEDSIENRVQTMLQKAYWDAFDESLTAKRPDPLQAVTIFNEIKQMMFQLLMPHNKSMRQKIEEFLDETTIATEVRHHALDFKKYGDFVIDILGQLCCPARDVQVEALKEIEKPSEVLRGLMELMEQMQLDMANFLISQIRPTIIQNCVNYERLKFAKYMDFEYQLKTDALRVTRTWLLREKQEDRTPTMAIGHAFGSVLFWKEQDWPETLTLDWTRFVDLASETERILIVGSTVYNAFAATRGFFKETEFDMTPATRHQEEILKCFPCRDAMKKHAVLIFTKEEIASPDKLAVAMDLVIEQYVQIINNQMEIVNPGQTLSPEDVDFLFRSMRDILKHDHPVRMVLRKRITEYITDIIKVGNISEITVPKALKYVKGECMTLAVEFLRIVMHNRAVYEDVYEALIEGRYPPPKFMEEPDSTPDSRFLEVVKMLRTEPGKTLKKA